MSEAQWLRVKEITADALERETADRAAFIEQACGDDGEVKGEVLRLVANAGSAKTGLLSTPPLNFRHIFTYGQSPCFAPGQEIAGRFRIDRFLNRGGMGEVYAALDLELQEMVALKTINPDIASSAGVIERFKREVKESRRIANASVCRVYDLFSHEPPEAEPIWFLTMELLDGFTLREVLATSGPMGFHQAVPFIRDMTGALSAAHALGIVHRDFKPSNVMIVRNGAGRERAVVTDFGLALNLAPESSPQSVNPGEGTPGYMAPEQRGGGNVTFAADQFALGLVMCEMLTGGRPELALGSAAESRRELRAWLKAPCGHKLNGRAKAAVRRCLEFSPERRYRNIGDILPVLDGSRERTRWRWAGAVAAAGVAMASVLYLMAPEEGRGVKDAALLTPESGLAETTGISREGKWVVYASDRTQPGNLDIWIQDAAGGPARRLTSDPAVDEDPTISPDGKLVAFRSERNGGGIYVVSSDGSGERLLVPGGRSPAFSPDGQLIAFWVGSRDDAAPSGRLYVIGPQGGMPRRLGADFADARYPTWNSTGKLLLFEGCRVDTTSLSTCTDWWVMEADGSNQRDTGAIALLKSQKVEQTTPPQKAWRGDEVVFSAAHGTLVALWAQRLTGDARRAVGFPRRLTPGELEEREPAVAENGGLVFGRITAAIHIWRLPLNPQSGSAMQVTDDPALDACPSISHDGRWLFFTRKIHGLRQVMVRDLVTGRESTMFTSEENKFWPISSPNGERVVFETRRDADSSLWIMDRSGGLPRKLCTDCSHPTSWFGDKGVLYTTAAGEIALLDVTSGSSRVVVVPPPGLLLGSADWNSANQNILFTAGKQGEEKQVYDIHFPATAELASERWVQLTDDRAEIEQPHWSVDGRTFYYLSKRDAFNCVWGRLMQPHGKTSSPFTVMHYHDRRFSPDRASPVIRGLTVGPDAVFLSVGGVTETLWLGRIDESPLAILFRRLPFFRPGLL